MSATTTTPWPTEISVSRGKRRVRVSFDNGERFDIPASLLRVMTSSAQARGHGAPVLEPAPIALDASGVNVAEVTPIGRYAVRIAFTDGHDSGLYTWEALHRIGRDRAKLEAAHAGLMAGPT